MSSNTDANEDEFSQFIVKDWKKIKNEDLI